MRRRALLGLGAGGALIPLGLVLRATDDAPVPAEAHWRGIVLPDLHGSLRAVAGASVVNLWARWCGPCRRELPALQRLSQQLAATGQVVLTIALDDDAFALREYVRGIGLALPVLQAATGASPAGLRPASLPQTLRLGPDGTVEHRVTGARDWDDAAARHELMGDRAGRA